MGLPKTYDLSKQENLRVGVTCYENFYSNEELKDMEGNIEETEKKSLQSNISPFSMSLDGYLPMTA